MASHLQNYLIHQTPVNYSVLENLEHNPTQISLAQWEEDITKSPIAHLNFSPEDNGSWAKQELQALWEMFTSWLQPENQSKEQMISKLVLEQFLKTGHCKDQIALRKKWESTGRDMGRFMEGLTDEYLKPPTMIRVSLNRQEALFSENMSLKEVIKILKQQRSEKNVTQENPRTDFQNTQYILLVREDEDSQDGQNNPWNMGEVNGDVSSPENTVEFLSSKQTVQFSDAEKESFSDGIPQDCSRTSQVSSRNHEESQRAISFIDVSMKEEQQSVISRAKTTECGQHHNTDSTGESNQERHHRNPQTYQSEKSFRTTKYKSKHIAQQKIQKKERTFFCKTCGNGFYTRSDLGVHEVIHKRKKPFKCRRCGRPFSHKTNLVAHERIHTGEKPYTCSSCNHSFRQSSTYHRHKRKCNTSN